MGYACKPAHAFVMYIEIHFSEAFSEEDTNDWSRVILYIIFICINTKRVIRAGHRPTHAIVYASSAIAFKRTPWGPGDQDDIIRLNNTIYAHTG